MTQNVIDTPLITLSGAFTMTGGAFTFTGTLTGNTNVTFPTSGTLLTTTGYPAPGATAGKIIISDGVNWIASTALYPATTTINQILYSSAANTVVGLATTASAVLTTSAGGVPAWTVYASSPFVLLAGSTMTGALILNTSSPSTPLQAASKGYVDSVASGLSVVLACRVATTANLSATYANGAAGVGATLTNNGAMAALTIDSVLTVVNDRVLVKNQTTTFQNGIYTVTTVGSGAVNWVLTRATDYDTAAEILPGTLVSINEGTTQSGTAWIETATVTTVGTDPVLFSQFAAIQVGTGLTLTGNTISLTIPVLVTSGGTGSTTAAGARTNLGLVIGTNVEAWSAVLDQVAAGTYTGSTSIITLGTVITGTWNASTITVPYGGTGLTATTPYAVLCGGTTGTGALQSIASVGTAGQVLTSNGAGMLPTFQAGSGGASTAPQITVYLSGSGNYTTPVSPAAVYLVVEMVGGGGGGTGPNTANNATSGGASTFGVLTAGGGTGANTGYVAGTGGGATGGDVNTDGGAGANGHQNPGVVSPGQAEGGNGGNSYFGGGGRGGYIGQQPGLPGGTNTGGGGGGGSTLGGASNYSGSGGGSGAYCRKIITTPAANYAYSVGAGGAHGTGSVAGGDGAAGIIIVTAYF